MKNQATNTYNDGKNQYIILFYTGRLDIKNLEKIVEELENLYNIPFYIEDVNGQVMLLIDDTPQNRENKDLYFKTFNLLQNKLVFIILNKIPEVFGCTFQKRIEIWKKAKARGVTFRTE